MQATKDGVALQWTIESIRAEQSTPKAAKELLNRLSGTSFTVHLDSHFRITKFEGYHHFIAKLVKSDKNSEKLANAVLPEEMLKDSIELLFDFQPKKKVAKGDSWTVSHSEAFGSFGRLTTREEIRLIGFAEGNKDIVQIKGRYANEKSAILKPNAAPKGLPFEIESAKVSTASSETSIGFDVTKGMLKSRRTERKLTAEFTIVKDKRKLSLEIEQDSSTSIEILDKLPVPK